MSGKARRVPPHAAFCEEYDEIARAVRPETRQVANVSTRRSKNDLKVSEHTVDGASDSGYSSRTAATVNSGQFPPSGRRSPLTQRLDSTTKLAGTERRRESRKDKGKEREDRLPAGEATTMQVESLRNSSRLGPGQRSSSKSKRRESMSARPHPASCWECEQGRYHHPVGGDGRPMELPYYVPPQAPVPDLPASSPKSARLPFHFIHDVPKSQGSHPQRRNNRSNSYHANNRPISFHGMAPDMNMMYNMPPMGPFEHGPPLSASAFANTGSFTPMPFPQQHPQYYPDQQPAPQAIYERTRGSKSGTKDHPRRQSMYGAPVVEYPPDALTTYDGGAAERRLTREHRVRPSPKVEDGGALERLSSREHRARPTPPKTEDEDTMLERLSSREHRIRPPPKSEDEDTMLERLSSREFRPRPPPKSEDEDNTMLERLSSREYRPRPPPKPEDEDNTMLERQYRVRPQPKSEDEDNTMLERQYRVRPQPQPKSEDEDAMLERLSNREYRVRPTPKSEDEDAMLERLSNREYRVRPTPKSEDEDAMLERLSTREYRVRPSPKSEDEETMLERLSQYRVRQLPKSEEEDIMLERLSAREYRVRPSLKSEDEDTALERIPSREHRVRQPPKTEETQLLERLAALRLAQMSSKPYDIDEDFYRMPPPPPPPPKQKPPPQVIQKQADSSRKQVAPPANNDRRLSQQSFDFSELEAMLPSNQALRKLSRDQIMPVRAHSVRNPRITAAYHETGRPGPMTVDDSHHHQATYYEDESPPDTGSDFDQKQREVEEYQAAVRGNKPVPLTADALRAKTIRPDSDSGSMKSRSNSSHGSDIRTRDGSGVGSKFGDDSGFAMVVNGVTMNFPQELVGSKRICVRTGEQGEMELNIEGRRPKKYLASRSDFTSSSGRNDLRRTLGSDRASRHSSRSTYSGGFYD